MLDPNWKRSKGKLGSTGIEDHHNQEEMHFEQNRYNRNAFTNQARTPPAKLPKVSNNQGLWKMSTV